MDKKNVKFLNQEPAWQLRHPQRLQTGPQPLPIPRPKKKKPNQDGQDSSKRG